MVMAALRARLATRLATRGLLSSGRVLSSEGAAGNYHCKVATQRLSSNAGNNGNPIANGGNNGNPIARMARYLNTVLCSHVVAKTSWPTTGTPSVVINRVNPAFVDCVGVKRLFSSAASSNNGVSREAKTVTSGT